MGLDRTFRRLFPAVVLVLLGVAAYFQASGLGQIAASFGLAPDRLVGPVAPSRRQPPSALAALDRAVSGAPILDRNPFDSVTGPLRDKPAPPPPETAPDDGDALACESGRVVLIAWSEDPEWSFASIVGGDGKSALRRAGDDFGDYRVERIEWDRVFLATAAGRRCQMEVGGKLAVAPAGKTGTIDKAPPPVVPVKSLVPKEIADKIHVIDAGHITVERSVIGQLMEQQAQLFRSVRASPDKDGGLRVAGVRSGTLLDMLGVKNGDSLLSVNGISVADPTRAITALATLRDAPRLTVALQRAGAPLTVQVDIQ